MTAGAMETEHAEIVRRAYAAFRADAEERPPMSLRGGNAVDGYDTPPPYDAALDAPTGGYLERHRWGIPHLDAASWRHYLPRLVEHALAHFSDPTSQATEWFLFSLRPPDRDPPRLGSLDPLQERVVADFLHSLAFAPGSAWSGDAAVALEEWWGPAPLYRPSADVRNRSDPLFPVRCMGRETLQLESHMPRFSFLQPVKTNRWRTGLLLLLVALAAWLISDLVLTRRPEPGPGPGNGYQIIKY